MMCASLGCSFCFCMCWFTKFLQWNTFSRHRSIAAILFRLYLVYKTSYHSLSIITTTQHIWLCAATFECFVACVTKVISTYNAYMWKVKCNLLYCWNIETCVEISNRFFHHNKLFSDVKFCRCHSSRILKTQMTNFLFV